MPIPEGRLSRLGRLASLAPRAGLAFAREQLGGEARLGAVMADALGEMKAGSHKLGQLLAQVGEDLPAGDRLQLGRLYAEAEPLAPEVARAAVEAALGAPISQVFARWDPAPFAAASLGQVHGAALPDGTEVAVKVQYPGVGPALAQDLDNLGSTVRGLSGGGLIFDPSAPLAALRSATLAELDYTVEAASLARVGEALADQADLVLPRVLQATPQVLVMTRLLGPTLHAWMGRPQPEVDRARVAAQLLRALIDPIFRAGVVQADAHPGNFLVLSSGALGLLDFGALAPVPPEIALGLVDLVRAGRGQGDLAAALARCGMRLELSPARQARFVAALGEALGPALSGPCNYGQRSVLAALGEIKLRMPVESLGGRPEPEALPVVRMLVGLHHALRRLAVPVDLGAAVLAAAGSGGDGRL